MVVVALNLVYKRILLCLFLISHTFQISNLQEECEKDVENIQEEFKEEQTTLKTMCYMLELAKKNHNQQFRAEYHSKLDDEETKNYQNIQRLKGILETNLGATCNGIKNFLINHKSRTQQRKDDHDYLVNKDNSMQTIIRKQTDNLHLSYETINDYNRKLNDTQKLLGRREKDLQSEYDFFFLAFGILKDNLVKDRRLDFKKISFLTKCFNQSIRNLDNLKSKVEVLLSVSAVCRKLETQEEKVMPFPLSFNSKDIGDLPTEKSVKEYIDQLDLFFQKVGQADALRYAINEEKDYLKKENQLLKMKVHRYCQCLSCPIPDKRVTMVTKHVTEGNHEYRKYMKQQVPQFVGKKHEEEETGEHEEEDSGQQAVDGEYEYEE